MEVFAIYSGLMANQPADVVTGDADIARMAAHFADPTRAKVLMALADGRSLPASVLAAEAGVSAPAASAQLGRLLNAGLLAMERSGRHRYYRLSGPGVADTLEALAKMAPSRPIRSLRDGTRAQAVRRARTCYDHLAGELGVQITAGLLERRALLSTDGVLDTTRRDGDRLSAQLVQHPYEIGPEAIPVLTSLGIERGLLEAGSGTRRPLVRICLDWSEQRHHIAGGLGRAILDACLEQEWVRRRPRQRAVTLTTTGADRLESLLGVGL